jgi:PadR family transcriptional regulator, regulatory protein PadR
MDKIDLLQGNLEMMILRVLSGGAQHGWGVAQRIHVLSATALKIEEGSLYLALYRMKRKGWIKAEWAQSENNRRARYWELTTAGRRRLEESTTAWGRLCAAIASVMKEAPAGDR